MDPFTLASSGFAAIGNLFSGLLGASASNAQAKADEMAAHQADAEASVRGDEALMEGDAAAAHGAVQAAANGGGFTGSTLGVIQQLSANAMFNARARIYQGQTEARNDLYNAAVAKTNARNQTIGAIGGAISPALSGWAKASYQSQILQRTGSLRNGGADNYTDYAPQW